jgi:hypothetical protein
LKTQYQLELDELAITFERARQASAEELRRTCLALATGPAIFVGTGGTMALAQLACDLHVGLSQQLGTTATPLELMQLPPLERCGALFFSARAKHPDAQLVLERLSSGDFRSAALLTHRDPADLTRLGPDVQAIQIEAPKVREGFLATNSVLAMATHLVQAFGGDVGPDVVTGVGDFTFPAVKDRSDIVVLYPPRLKAVALDFETRCSELGIASVQMTDLRNIAHGRHTGLARRCEETTLLLLSDAASDPLASRVQAVLKDVNVPLIRWHADLPSDAACLRFLAASMQAVGRMAGELGIDPARPRVPEFGRRLYNLPIKKLLRRKPEGPIELKAKALGAGHIDESLEDLFEDAFNTWRTNFSRQAFGGAVVDYDGTVCFTQKRREHPTQDMQAALLHVLEEGFLIGFATGRGKSIYKDLREWVPQHLWSRVHLGLYNGAVRLKLVEDLPDLRTPGTLMSAIEERVSSSPIGGLTAVEARCGQVSVRAKSNAFFHDLALARIVRDLLNEEPSIDAKVVSSAHSVDVIAPDTTKVAVLRELEAITGRPVFAIGDQGQSGGNDFELLAATTWSISVDRCSADPTRCWRIGRAGRRGPEVLEEILTQLKLTDGTARLAIRP